MSKGIKLATSGKVVDLYRRICREIPRACVVYDLDENEKNVRKLVRRLFDKNAGLRDPRVIKVKLEEGEQHLMEVANQWKQKTHLHRLLDLPEVQPFNAARIGESHFLKSFYANS